MLKASCLCGEVRYEITGTLSEGRYCHCINCRKFAGTSPASWAMTDSAGLIVTTGADQVTRYDSGLGQRCFCWHTGTR